MNIANYYTVSRSSGKVIGNVTGYEDLEEARKWMNHIKQFHPDTVVIAGETCEIVAE